jgi:type I restriction enzyme, R subunit
MSSESFNSSEKHQSQIPALQLLVALGFKPLSQEEALRLRGGRLRNVVLDDILESQLQRLNRYSYRGNEYEFDLEDTHEAIRRLKPTPDRLKGLRGTNQDIYDTLILGTTITKSIDGDSKSYSFRYIDWENPENNVFHVTAEFAVERTASTQTRRCDIVGFVNGIPFLVIENKRPTESLKKAGSQLIGYQNEDNIPQLFHFAQLLTLCRPERLLDLIRRFTVFDGGVRKVARHQQFFGIRRAVERSSSTTSAACARAA